MLTGERAFTYTMCIRRATTKGIYMTPQEYKKVLAAEIKKVNQRIDFKILRGERYSEDSKRHRELLKKLQNHHKKNRGFFRLLPGIALF